MLSIKWITGVDYYLKKKRKRRGPDAPEDGDDPDDPEDGSGLDYYFDIGEGVGEWWGSGAKLLGLSGTVQAADLKALCQGFGPDGIPLIQNAGAEDHQQAWDLTYSAPKSVSVLWSQVDTATRAKIQKLHRRAIDAALSYLADVAILTRRGKGGVILEHALPIVAIFDDTISRELDPQLHSHCLLLNVAGRSDETCGTILSKPFFRHKLTAGAIYQTELAHLLRSELGLRIVHDATAFRVVGVPEKLIDFYSTRANQIRRILHSKGYHSAKAAAVAALDTRKAKSETPPLFNELLERWQQTNQKFGFSLQTAHRLLGKSDFWLNIDTLERRIATAMHELLKSESYFSEQELIRQVARAIMAEGISAKNLIDLVRAFLVHNPQTVPLVAVEREPLFTTKEILSIEAELLASIDKGKVSKSHVVPKQVVDQILNGKLPLHNGLTEDERIRNEEQRNAVSQVTSKSGDIQVIEGMAGTGKTHTLNVARQVWSKAGFRVVGLALSAAAAANLKKGAEIESETIALRLLQLQDGFASHHKRQLKRFITGKRTYAYRGSPFRLDRKTVVVVDEAGMVGTQQLAELVKHVKKAGAKLVLVGDRRQLQPIDGGGPFAAIASRTVPAELRHVIRQQIEPYDPNPTWHRQAGQLIANGHVALALKLFSERGRLNVLAARDQAMLSLVRDWSVRGMENPTDHVVLAGTREEVKTLNHMCQSARKAAGVLGTAGVPVGEQAIYLGDLVLFTRNARTLGINNGDRGRVIAFHPYKKQMAVELERTKKQVFVNYREYTHCQLGYAMTTHKAQGATVPSVYVLLGGAMQDRHLSYVQTTRACESTRLYVDKYHAGPDMRHLLNQMAKLRPKRLAHELLPKNTNNIAPPPPRSKSPNHRGSATQPRPAQQPTLESVQSQQKPPSQPAPLLDEKTIEKLIAQLRANQPPPKPKKSVKHRPIVTREQLRRWEADDIRSDVPSDAHADSVPVDKARQVKFEVPRRDILDLSHITVSGSIDRSVVNSAIDRYGKMPGGIVVEGKACCDFPLYELAFDPERPSCLIINGNNYFETGLSAIEIAELWDSILESRQTSGNFGVLTQQEAVGIDEATIIATSMMTADNALGSFVYGYDSEFKIRQPDYPFYSNPFLNEITAITSGNTLSRQYFNYLFDRSPQCFLRILDVHFVSAKAKNIVVDATQVQAVLGFADQQRVSKAENPSFHCDEPTVEFCFPSIYAALQHFVRHFVKYAQQEPSMARTIAYAEVAMLMRHAKSENATLLGQQEMWDQLYTRDEVIPPRYNYTIRSAEFARRTSEVARYLSCQSNNVSYAILASAVVGLRFAAMSGDFDAFMICKTAAIRCIIQLHNRAVPDCYRDIHGSLTSTLNKIHNTSHDILIDNLLADGRDFNQAFEQRTASLVAARHLCGSETQLAANPRTRCQWLEIESFLNPSFDPVPGFVQACSDRVSLHHTYQSLSRITLRRSESRQQPTWDAVLSAIARIQFFAATPYKIGNDAWQTLHCYAELEVLHYVQDLLDAFRLGRRSKEENDHLIDTNQNYWLVLRVCAERLRTQSSNVFESQLLHWKNFFLGSHPLLRFESPEFLERWVDGASVLDNSDKRDAWWKQLLRDLALPSASAISANGVLMIYELQARKLTVEELRETMARYDTENPQAALLFFDLEQRASV